MTNQKLETNSQVHHKKIGIVGLGFVGLPLALLFVKKGFDVIGIDIDTNKIEKLNEGNSYITDIKSFDLQEALSTGRLRVTADYDTIKNLDVVIVSVPTPLTTKNTPDLSYLIKAGEELIPRLKKGQLIVLESSTFPGTTKEVFLPLLEKSGLLVGKDLFLAYSPERIDPSNKKYRVENIPKIVSGVTDKCLNSINLVLNL